MYNTDIPTRAELPTSMQLLRSTVIAILAAAAILVTIVLPAEYAIDPTGVGRALELTEMGEIKTQLAEEAEHDRLRELQNGTPIAVPARDQQSSLLERVFAELVMGSASAQELRTDE
ncbi:transmembrane anchor protein, partial [Mesorhizobium sp. M0848]